MSQKQTSASEVRDLNFKVAPEWHQAVKMISAVIDIPMKDFVLLVVTKHIKMFGSSKIRDFIPDTEPWAHASAGRFNRFFAKARVRP